MASATRTAPQDLPPKGGYGPLKFDRVKLRQLLSGKTTLFAYVATTAFGYYVYTYEYRQFKRDMIEQLSGRFAIQALLQSERDRLFLKQIRRNRDAEAELMKNYPGWEVGKLYSESIYQGDPPDTFIDPNQAEYFAHSKWFQGCDLFFDYHLYV